MIHYEWAIETVNLDEFGDVEETQGQESCRHALEWAKRWPAPQGMRNDLVLVRDDDERRSWAYFTGDTPPTHFQDAYQIDRAKVPKAYLAEYARAMKNNSKKC